MPKILTVEQMQAFEKQADEGGLSYGQMMENAGRSVAEAILNRLPSLAGQRVVILAGSGNNGGDGLVAGHHLSEAGAEVSVYLATARGDDDPHLERLKERGLLIAEAGEDQRHRVLKNSLAGADVVIDALLGTGLRLPLRGGVQEVLASVQSALGARESRPFVVAVDCPSGLDCDNGDIAQETLAADLTVTLAAAKQGLLRFPGAEKVGELVVGDIGMTEQKTDIGKVELELATAEAVIEWLPRRRRNSHKGTFGTAVVAGGSITLPGAAVLAGWGAYRVGAGLVTLAVPSSVQSLLAPQLPEATWILLPHEMGLLNENAVDVLVKELDGVAALALGPGLGWDDPTEDFLTKLFGLGRSSARGKIGFVAGEAVEGEGSAPLPPLVVDADALKLLVKVEDWPKRLPPAAVLTPHPGELAIMTGEAKEDLQEDRVATAQKYAAEWGHVLVYKGAFTVIAAPDGRTSVLPFATSALATAGTGDVLAGAILGFRAQGLAAYEAAVLGGYVHGRAGEMAAMALGSEAAVVAGDVADCLADAMAELRHQAAGLAAD